MANLLKMLEGIEYEVISGDADIDIVDISIDSRQEQNGNVFVCIPGTNVDGHDFAEDVAKKGAKCLIVEHKIDGIDDSICQVKVENARYALAMLSCAYFDNPADKLHIIGITGTKGKTTTTYMVKSILENAGLSVGLVGTIEIIIGDEHIPALNTTPESYVLQKYFKDMVDAGVTHCVMEVSSQGLMMDRVAGVSYDIGIFTNISDDHIGPTEHKDFDEYLMWKGQLFKRCKLGVFNIDDDHYDDIIKYATCKSLTFGFSDKADYRAGDITLVRRGGHLGVAYDLKGKIEGWVETGMPGKFSVYNSLCAIAICDYYGIGLDDMKESLKNAFVKGRIEMIHVSDEYTLMIDYAHNAMSLESLLTTLREYKPARLICLFGCGGNRSKVRRYEMGEVSGRFADLSIITSDNPRFEDPDAIVDDIIEGGVKKTGGEYVRIVDRREAIKYAIDNAMPGDIIVLAGKGHEDYQEIEGVKYDMDERDIIRDIIGDEN